MSTPALRLDGPPGARPLVVLAHGAGAPMDDPFLETITQGLAARGIPVARFEFPYMAARRADGRRRPPDREAVLLGCWRSVVASLGGASGLVLGGKSLGGRMASLVADELSAQGLVCLGYPFHPPGKPERPRIAHLASLRTPALVVQGTRDPFGTSEEVPGYTLATSIRVHWIEDGDHSLRPRKASGRTHGQNLAAAVEAVAAFLDETGRTRRGDTR
jgi:uncharacterized protein